MDVLITLTHRFRLHILLMTVSIVSVAAFADDTGPTRADQMKAASIVKFARYIHWSDAESDSNDRANKSICILGKDPYNGALQALQDSANITVRQLDNIDQTTGCRMLVIGESEPGRLDQVLRALEGQKMVTISEINGFTDQGGMIRLYAENNRIRFDINQGAARDVQLRFDLRLTRLATTVID